MRSNRPQGPAQRSGLGSRKLARWAVLPIGLAVAIVLAGCTSSSSPGISPLTPRRPTRPSRVIGLWVTSWIVLLGVGVVTWGLIIWAAVVYRRRKGQTGLPVQLRYNLPIEIFYTIVPLILIIGFFAFTARDQEEIERDPGNPDVQIEVFGKRWSWDFNYVNENVYSAGIQAQERLNGDGTIDEDRLPVLYLPVDAKVQINIESRDVVHSFWIIDFLYKKDMIPAQTNHWYFIPQKERQLQGQVRRAVRRVPLATCSSRSRSSRRRSTTPTSRACATPATRAGSAPSTTRTATCRALTAARRTRTRANEHRDRDPADPDADTDAHLRGAVRRAQGQHPRQVDHHHRPQDDRVPLPDHLVRLLPASAACSHSSSACELFTPGLDVVADQ